MQISRRTILKASGIILLVATNPVHAAQEGTAEEAKALLARATSAIRADKAKALASFSSGADGFKDRDLYVFCARRDGTVDAHIDPREIGHKLQDLYDREGVAFGQEMMAVAQEGQIKAVAYMWPRPGSPVPVHKVSFVTRVGDQICGVGYYN